MPTFVFLKNKEKVKGNLSIRIVLPIYEEMQNFKIDPAQVADLTGANIDKLKAIVAEHKWRDQPPTVQIDLMHFNFILDCPQELLIATLIFSVSIFYDISALYLQWGSTEAQQ